MRLRPVFRQQQIAPLGNKQSKGSSYGSKQKRGRIFSSRRMRCVFSQVLHHIAKLLKNWFIVITSEFIIFEASIELHYYYMRRKDIQVIQERMIHCIWLHRSGNQNFLVYFLGLMKLESYKLNIRYFSLLTVWLWSWRAKSIIFYQFFQLKKGFCSFSIYLKWRLNYPTLRYFQISVNE